MDDALTNAKLFIDTDIADDDGSKTAESAVYWLGDEDSEMVQSTVAAAGAELQRASTEITKERVKLEDFQAKVSEKVQSYSADVTRYAAEVQKETARINGQGSKYQKEV